MGDACEMLIAAELTLRGIPALKVPDLWPEYDVIAQPVGREPQRVSVKSCAFKAGSANHIAIRGENFDKFDWLAIVLLDSTEDRRRFYIVPAQVALDASYSAAYRSGRSVRVGDIPKKFAQYEDNFALVP